MLSLTLYYLLELLREKNTFLNMQRISCYCSASEFIISMSIHLPNQYITHIRYHGMQTQIHLQIYQWLGMEIRQTKEKKYTTLHYRKIMSVNKIHET